MKAGNTGICGTAYRVDCLCIRANDPVGAQGGSKYFAVKWFLKGIEKGIKRYKPNAVRFYEQNAVSYTHRTRPTNREDKIL